jgi:hypothetical protein
MDVSRKAVARSMNNFRYAVRSGACGAAEFHLRYIARTGAVIGDQTWKRLNRMLKNCKVAPHFNKRRKPRRDMRPF